jgi:hypothetical protein
MTMQQAIDQIWAMFRETDRKFQETDRKFQETDRKFQETDRKLQETDRRLQDTDCKIREMSEAVGQLGNRIGEFVEGLVKPAVVRLFRERGIEVHEVHRDVSASRDGLAAQVDLLVVDDEVCVAVEVKSRLSVDDVDEHLDRMGRFKRLFPSYASRRAHGAVAAMVIPDNVATYAYRKGLFVIGMRGDALTIFNDSRFHPAIW